MPRIVDHDKRRADLLDAAFTCFDTQGYGAVSMRDLAASLHVSTGTLYHYFDGKEAIFEALVRRRFETDLAAANAGMAAANTPDERFAALAAWIGGNVAHLRSTLRLVLDFVRQHDTPPPWVIEVLEGYRGPLAESLGEDLAEPALSLLLGMLVQELLTGREGGRRDHLAALLRWRS
ncbi:MAG: TetR/AcrR family transcriptional regulator [Myxococcota bacterium]